MKFLIVFGALIAFASCEANVYQQEAIKALKACNTGDLKVSNDLLEKLKNPLTATKDDRLIKLVVCANKKMDWMEADGTLKKENIKNLWSKVYTPEQLAKMEPCLVQKDTPENTAWDLLICKGKAVGISTNVVDEAKV